MKPKQDKLLPGDSVEVDVDVRDQQAKGIRSEVTLYAVDEGVLSLDWLQDAGSGLPVYRSAAAPSFHGRFTPVACLIIGNCPRAGASSLLDKGLEGGGGGGESMRRDFVSVYFNPALVTDASGHAHASFKLPDSLTTYRVMAVAVAEDDRFGGADARQVIASRPLMARPAMSPVGDSSGDRIEAGVVITSKGLARTRVEVEATTDGLVLDGTGKRAIHLEANGSIEVRFPFGPRRRAQRNCVFVFAPTGRPTRSRPPGRC